MAELDAGRQRIALVLEYDGRPFSGWQQQENAPSVQQTLQVALSGIEGRAVQAIAAGRTDAAVHAEAMLVHADVDAGRWNRSPMAYVHGLNSHLPESVRVVAVHAVPATFHARFDCRERAYSYRIWNRTTASALHAWRHWWMPRRLDESLMREAAALAVGRMDFSALRAAGCQASGAVRTIRELTIRREGFVVGISVRADAFLYHMVRNLVGNLVDVGIGRVTPEDFGRLLDSGDRSKGGATAPAHGLYFTDAVYDDFSSRSLLATPGGRSIASGS